MSMKKTVLIIAAAAGLAVGAAAMPVHGHGKGAMHPAGAFEGGMMLQHITRILHRLDLSDGQRENIHAILEAARPEFQERMESLRAARHELWNLDPAAFDETRVRELARSHTEEMVELMVLGQKVRSQVWAQLTPEQREEAAEMRTRMQQRMQKMRNCMGKTAKTPVE